MSKRRYAVREGSRIVIDGKVHEGPATVTIDDDHPQVRSWVRSGVLSWVRPKKTTKKTADKE